MPFRTVGRLTFRVTFDELDSIKGLECIGLTSVIYQCLKYVIIFQ